VTWIIVVGVALAVLGFALKVARTVGPMKLGDLASVPIPRSGPLAMGTRLEVAAALKKAGATQAEVRALIETGNDEELLRRYWELKDEEEDP
jgi:hypothetical protein